MTDRAASSARRRRTPHGPRSARVTERDCEILAFVAEHRLVVAGHVATLLGVSDTVAARRLGALATGGLLERSQLLHRQPAWYQITRPGLAVIESDLPPPRIDLRCYQHDIGVAWVWLAAARGAFGSVEHLVSERKMRSRDGAWLAAGGARSGSAGAGVAAASVGAAAGAGAAAGVGAAASGGPEAELAPHLQTPFGVRLGGVGPGGRVRLHYPDLLLVGPRGERVAVELELSSKGGRRLETILAGYGADPSIAAVVYLAVKPGIRREVSSTAARLGISDRVHVRQVAWPAGAEPATAPARTSGAPEVTAARRRERRGEPAR